MTNPTLVTTPFAESGDKNVIPESVGAQPQNATMQAGFPPVTQQKISEGGIPPERNDFNGILNLYGQHVVHLNKGLPYEFDAAFATAIGGYPLNARIMLADSDIVKNTAPNNTNDPNSVLTGWVKTNSASQIFDESGLSQQSYNNSIGLLAPLLETNTWEQNRDILQAVNDALYANYGGGTIRLPSGDFAMKGVTLDQNVHVVGNNTNIYHPDNFDTDIFRTRTFNTTYSATAGSFTINVANSDNIEVGCLIGLRGVGGINRTQNTFLVDPITSTDTTNLKVLDITGFSRTPTQSNILLCGSELITYETMGTDGLLTGVVRGALGTTATSHTTSQQIGVALRLVTEVIAKSGTSITVLDAPSLSVTNAEIMIGTKNTKVLNVNFIGDRQIGVAGWRWCPVRFVLHRFGEIDIYAEKTENVFSLNYSSDNRVKGVGKDVTKSNPSGVSIGSAVWFFQNCHRNKLDLKVVGDVWLSLALDDRTNTATEWDAPCNENYGTITAKYSNYNGAAFTTTGVVIASSNGNAFDVFCDKVFNATSIYNTEQTYNTDGFHMNCEGNSINVSAINCYRSINCAEAVGNNFTIYQRGNVVAPIIVEGNVVNSITTPTAGAFNRFRDGDYLNPGISFIADPSLGLWRSGAGDIRFQKSGVTMATIAPTGLAIPDGLAITGGTATGLRFGTSASQKYGFWGATPIVQPAIGVAATDPATTQTLVNNIRTALINAGLAKTS